MTKKANYIDVKYTVWQRFTINDESEADKVLKIVQEDKRLNDIFQYHDVTCETLYDTEERITVEENGGCSTIEVYDDGHECIWRNGNESTFFAQQTSEGRDVDKENT